MKKKYLTIGCGASFLMSLYGAPTAPKNNTPNIIIVNMDDMGYGDMEINGLTGVRTPNFNKVAQQGVRFTQFHSAQPVSSASRSGLLTGCYPTRLEMTGAILPHFRYALNPDEETIASMLKKAGYHTAMFGKWHLGNKAPYFPIHYGFDTFYGLPYSHDIWPIDYDGYTKVTDPKNYRSKYPPLPILSQDAPVDTVKNIDDAAQLTTRFTEKTVAYIKENKKNPFFILLNHPLPHIPLAVSNKFKGKSGIDLYSDVIMELDWSIGEILKALDETNLTSNTLLIITSDNGPWKHFGEDAGSSGGFREGKSTAYEGGTEVPCIMQWPGVIKPGTVNSELMTNMDILPTIAAITSAPLPKNKIDGLNFLPVLTDEKEESPREVFFYYFGYAGKGNLMGVRYKNWKLILPHPAKSYEGSLVGKGGQPGVINMINAPMGLYNLTHDPGERYDVSTLYPEMLKKLQGLAEEARDELGDELTNRKGKGVRPAARY